MNSSLPTPYDQPLQRYTDRIEYRKTNQFRRVLPVWIESRSNSTALVGKLMEEIVKCNPQTHSEWLRYYFKEVKNSLQFGRVVERFASISGLTLREARAHVMIHVIDETWEGFARENAVMKALQKLPQYQGRTIIRASYSYDVLYGIDLVVEDTTSPYGFRECFQVKPGSFFASNRIGKDKAKIRAHHEKAYAKGMFVFFLNADEILNGTFKLYHYTTI